MAMNDTQKTMTAMSYDMSAVIDQYSEKTRLPAEALREHGAGDRRFLALSALNPGKYGMRGPLDELWHTFILFTSSYATFCRRVGGRFIHQPPGNAEDQIEAAPSDSSLLRLVPDYRRLFKEAPPAHLWPRPGGSVIDPSCDQCGVFCDQTCAAMELLPAEALLKRSMAAQVEDGQRVKILVIGKFPPIEGGVSGHTFWLARALAGQGHSVHVVTNAREVEATFAQLHYGDDPRWWQESVGAGHLRVHQTTPVAPGGFIPFPPHVTKLFGLSSSVRGRAWLRRDPELVLRAVRLRGGPGRPGHRPAVHHPPRGRRPRSAGPPPGAENRLPLGPRRRDRPRRHEQRELRNGSVSSIGRASVRTVTPARRLALRQTRSTLPSCWTLPSRRFASAGLPLSSTSRPRRLRAGYVARRAASTTSTATSR